jgi:hypothetical protein
MAKYKISGDGVQDTETGSFIPNDPKNRHWIEYQQWLLGDGTSVNIVDPEFSPADMTANAWIELRSERNNLLNKTDFFMTYDFYNNILTSQEQTDIEAYRQALRDLPSNTSDPTGEISWPEKPQILIDYGI